MASETSSVSSLSTQGEGRLPGGRLPKPPPTIALPFKRWIPEYHLSRAQEYHVEAINDVKLIGTKYQEWAKKAVYTDLVDVTGRVGGDRLSWPIKSTCIHLYHRFQSQRSLQRWTFNQAPRQYTAWQAASSAGVPLPVEAIEPTRTQPSTAPVPDDEVLDSVSDFLSDLRSDTDSTTTTPDLEDMMHTATPVAMPNLLIV